MAFEYYAQVVRVVDGDTLDLMVDLGFGVHKKDRFRLLDVDTPEIYGVKKDSEEYTRGKEASQFVLNWLQENCENNQVYIKTHKDKQGKYGRYLAHVCAEDLSLNKAIKEFMEKKGW